MRKLYTINKAGGVTPVEHYCHVYQTTRKAVVVYLIDEFRKDGPTQQHTTTDRGFAFSICQLALHGKAIYTEDES